MLGSYPFVDFNLSWTFRLVYFTLGSHETNQLWSSLLQHVLIKLIFYCKNVCKYQTYDNIYENFVWIVISDWPWSLPSRHLVQYGWQLFSWPALPEDRCRRYCPRRMPKRTLPTSHAREVSDVWRFPPQFYP